MYALSITKWDRFLGFHDGNNLSIKVGNPSVLPDVQTSSDPRFHRERSVRKGLITVPVCDRIRIGNCVDKSNSDRFMTV